MVKGPDDLKGILRKIGTGLRRESVEERKIEARAYPDLVAKYRLFRDATHFKAGTVYHPCGAADVSPSAAFSGGSVVYADIDDKSMEALRLAGYDAHTADARQFNPGPVDTLVLLNPQIEPDIPASFVKEGGYVLSNNYHSTADRIKSLGFRPVGVIIGREKEVTFDTQDLEKYWEEVETDEEFKAANEHLFADAARIVGKIRGGENNVIKEYRNIISEVRNDALQGASNLTDIQVAVTFDYSGERLLMPTRLPRKKGVVDDMFVFQKESHE